MHTCRQTGHYSGKPHCLTCLQLQILNAAEEREKKLIALEEEVARRRRDLEHDHTSRLAEAEATVRRLQVTCFAAVADALPTNSAVNAHDHTSCLAEAKPL